jgi:hypothetical protein
MKVNAAATIASMISGFRGKASILDLGVWRWATIIERIAYGIISLCVRLGKGLSTGTCPSRPSGIGGVPAYRRAERGTI